MSLDPLIGAISAGNTVMLKPSELSPNSSSFLSKTLPSYLDPKAIKIIEGGPDVAALLLQHKWDKIFFTGIKSFYYSINPLKIWLSFRSLLISYVRFVTNHSIDLISATVVVSVG